MSSWFFCDTTGTDLLAANVNTAEPAEPGAPDSRGGEGQGCSTGARRMGCPSSVADTVVVRELFDVAGGLARSYLFEDLTADELAPLAAVVTTRRLVRGESLCR